MTIILNQCDKATRAEISLCSSYEDNSEVEEFIKFLASEHIVWNNTNDVNVFFSSQVTKITKHYFRPTPIVEELLSAHWTDDAV